MKQKSDIQRILLVLLGAIVMALNIKIFVRAGDMFPGGFNGLTLLIQRTASEYFHLALPFFRHQPAAELHSCCHQLPLYRQEIHRLFLYDDCPFQYPDRPFPQSGNYL